MKFWVIRIKLEYLLNVNLNIMQILLSPLPPPPPASNPKSNAYKNNTPFDRVPDSNACKIVVYFFLTAPFRKFNSVDRFPLQIKHPSFKI